MNFKSISVSFAVTTARILLFSSLLLVESHPGGSGATNGLDPKFFGNMGPSYLIGNPPEKLREKFSESPFSNEVREDNGNNFKFDDWAKAAETDGWICRNHLDCTWIDENLNCADRVLVSVMGDWTENFVDSVEGVNGGQCTCGVGWHWDMGEAKCKDNSDGINKGIEAAATIGTWLIVVIVVSVLVVLGCCIGICCCVFGGIGACCRK